MKNNSFRDKLSSRLNPTKLIVLSFVLVIMSGAILLCMPISNVNGQSLSFLDNLFVSTSATCVTGLMPFVLMDQYTIFGQVVILFLMQIGGLGLMSIVALILILLKQKLCMKEKKVLLDAINKSNHIDLQHFLKSIFIYTLIFESIGFILLATKFIPLYGFDGIFKSLFVAVSAFCNAGLDNLTSNSLIPFADDVLVNLTVSALIITGGLGFAVWFDLKGSTRKITKLKQPLSKVIHHLTLHTRIVVITTLVLLASGTVLFMAIEYSNPMTIGNMSFGDKLMTSFFQSTTLRTAGFSTVDIGATRPATQFIMLFYMLIGGSPGGTAGGIKTTTFIILVFGIIHQLKNKEHLTIFKRTLSDSAFKKAFMIVVFYSLSLIVGITILLITEDLDFMALTFEAFSAIATVGLSTGITPLLSSVGKLVIITLMFVGRVGPMTVVFAVMRTHINKKASEIEYPSSDVLIG